MQYILLYSTSNSNINWGKEKDRKFNLTGETALLPADQWVKASFTFVPESDGKVTINLLSNYTKDKKDQPVTIPVNVKRGEFVLAKE